MTFLRSPLPTLSLQGASQHIEATFDQKSIRKQFKLNFSWLPFSLFCIITESLDVFESTGKPINRWLSIIFCKVLMLSVHTCPGDLSTSMWVPRDDCIFSQHYSHIWWRIGVSRKFSPGNFCTFAKISGEFAKALKMTFFGLKTIYNFIIHTKE